MIWRTILTIATGIIVASEMNLSMQETIIATIVGGLIVLIISAFGKYWLHHGVSEIVKSQTFRICFTDKDPPGSVEQVPGTLYPIPLGISSHWLKVVTNDGVNLDELNVRFVSYEEANKRPEHGPPEDITSIVSIKEVSVTPEIIAQGVKAIQTDDRHGGRDLKLSPVYPWGRGRALFLLIEVDAKQVWTGKISFRANDKNNDPRYARTEVRITDTQPLPPVQSKHKAVSATVVEKGSRTIVTIPGT